MILLKRLFLVFLLVTGGTAAVAQPGGGPSKAELKPLPVLPKMAAPSSLQGMVATVNAEDVLVLDLSTGGRVRVIMRPDVAPKHVERIRTLVRQGFYDGTVFHRVIEGFMAQGGDPTATGQGGSKLPDLEPEFNDLPHVRGALAMARAQAENSANSQFYIVLQPVLKLDRSYTVWGRVISGMQYVDAIEKGEPPANPSKIIKASIEADKVPPPAGIVAATPIPGVALPSTLPGLPPKPPQR
jgi:cyclophilin family peptidyl-prolyl cis-trans isomerase